MTLKHNNNGNRYAKANALRKRGIIYDNHAVWRAMGHNITLSSFSHKWQNKPLWKAMVLSEIRKYRDEQKKISQEKWGSFSQDFADKTSS